MLEHNHYQNAKYYSLTGHLILPEPIVMSKITWNKLTPEQQDMVKKAAKAAQAEERVLWDKKSTASEEKNSRPPASSSSPWTRNLSTTPRHRSGPNTARRMPT
nr:hypothetical protein GCM10020185_67900 [Pseudomonas brassicacearum subsp. brassicacearum]